MPNPLQRQQARVGAALGHSGMMVPQQPMFAGSRQDRDDAALFQLQMRMWGDLSQRVAAYEPIVLQLARQKAKHDMEWQLMRMPMEYTMELQLDKVRQGRLEKRDIRAEERKKTAAAEERKTFWEGTGKPFFEKWYPDFKGTVGSAAEMNAITGALEAIAKKEAGDLDAQAEKKAIDAVAALHPNSPEMEAAVLTGDVDRVFQVHGDLVQAEAEGVARLRAKREKEEKEIKDQEARAAQAAAVDKLVPGAGELIIHGVPVGTAIDTAKPEGEKQPSADRIKTLQLIANGAKQFGVKPTPEDIKAAQDELKKWGIGWGTGKVVKPGKERPVRPVVMPGKKRVADMNIEALKMTARGEPTFGVAPTPEEIKKAQDELKKWDIDWEKPEVVKPGRERPSDIGGTPETAQPAEPAATEAPAEAKKLPPATKEQVKEAIRIVGPDREKVRVWLQERGYTL